VATADHQAYASATRDEASACNQRVAAYAACQAYASAARNEAYARDQRAAVDVLVESSAALRHDGLKLMRKAPKLAPELEAASWSDHEAGAMAASNPEVDIPECGHYVAATDRDLLLLPCPEHSIVRSWRKSNLNLSHLIPSCQMS
jgi:hypothetical protein